MNRAPARGLTIQTLRGTSNNDIMRSIVNDHVKIIDAQILSTHNAGLSRIEYELPNNFCINNLDKADAQLLIYSELLRIYKDPISAGGKGFNDTTIEIGSTTWLRIAWVNGLSDQERESRKQLIRSCMH